MVLSFGDGTVTYTGPSGEIKHTYAQAGEYLVTVTDSAGKSDWLNEAVKPAPVITQVNPSGGTAAGGSRITITGKSLGAVTAVRFGSNAGTAVTVDGEGQVLVTTPAGTPGAVVEVAVESPRGNTIKANGFAYGAATLEGTADEHQIGEPTPRYTATDAWRFADVTATSATAIYPDGKTGWVRITDRDATAGADQSVTSGAEVTFTASDTVQLLDGRKIVRAQIDPTG